MPKSVKFNTYGTLDVLEIVDVPRPTLGNAQILVKTKAAGLNPGEAKIRDGSMREKWPATFPSGEGTDFSGIVDEVGSGVTAFKPGDEVAGYTHERASHAEYVVTDEQRITVKPKNVSWEVAGSLFVAGTTAYAAIEAVDLKAGETIAISGAAGGVGAIASQLATNKGAVVIGIANEKYHQWLSDHNITPVGYDGDIAAALSSAAKSIDAFVDTTGHGYVEIAVGLGIDPKRIDTIADFPAVERLGVQGVGGAAAAKIEVLKELLDLIASGKIEVPIAGSFPIDDVKEAYSYLGAKHDIGKVVLVFKAYVQ
jgi:NADPH:quinone reductase-like Zn-dependent oxidoreductase